ncbi:DUF6117 family protein [Mesorhizobium sp. B2-4-1]|uniref:DUF6117 family protein n=1 Tax=Mesorhizobium sp. B2-4-1 TaxID=2589948 RepID=UPI00112D81EB|nr:DUF6117 family protein [Mesorhizobium sp. B2-4-1]TPL66599.1 hypothetical protein FJ949_09540 [Mesorhizobium sp. B2-4-1]
MIPEHHRKNFDTLLRAAQDGQLALLECTDSKTGEPRYVLTVMSYQDDEYLMTPFGHLAEGNPFEIYDPPEA